MNLKIRIKNLNKLRSTIKKNKLTVGTWLQIPNSNSAEIISNNGFDWIAVDLEHSIFDNQKLIDIIRSIELNRIVPIVRVFSPNSSNLKKYLEIGFSGFIIPSIENNTQLENIYKQITFLPEGTRGVGFNRSNNFGEYFNTYHKYSNRPLLIAQIETKKGLDNIEEIINFKYLDGIFIGPYDLSSTLNVPGQFKNKTYLNAISKIINKCKKKKIACGIHVIEPNKKEVENYIKQGFSIIGYSLDSYILRKYLVNPFYEKK